MLWLVLALQATRFGVEPADLSNLDATLDAAAETGVGWISIRLPWGESADAVLAGAKKRNLTPFVTLLWRPYKRAAEPKAADERSLAAFREWVRATVERHDGDGVDDAPDTAAVKHWSVERHLGLLQGSNAAARVEVLTTARGAIKEADPDGKLVVGISATEEGVAELKRLIEHDVHNVVDVALYVAVREAASAGTHVAAARRVLEGMGRDAEAWVLTSEAVSGGKKTPKAQASEFLKRTCEYLRRDVGVKRLFWYPLADVAGDPDEAEQTKHDQNGGIITDRATRRPLFDVLKRTTELWKKDPSLEYVESQGAVGVTVYRFSEADGGTVYLAWAKTSKALTSQLVLQSDKPMKVTTIDGETKEAPDNGKGGKVIDLYNEPVVIRVPGS